MRQSVPASTLYEVAPTLPDGRNLFDEDSDPVALGLNAYRVPDPEMRASLKTLNGAGFTILAHNAFSVSAVSTDPAAGPHPDRSTGQMGLHEGSGLRFAAVPTTERHTNPLPPTTAFFCLRAPVDLLTALNGTNAALDGHDGDGVHIAIVNSGCDVGHPFFTERKARIEVKPGPGMTGLETDTLGHGTMICGTLVSVAPRARLTMIKTTDALSLAGFKSAVAMQPPPDVIENTWGHLSTAPAMSAYDKAVYVAITSAVAEGIVVVFAGGNQKIIFPPQVPAAIAAGGAYLDAQDLYRASDYSSGYRSAIFPDRGVPDVCGLVGPAPEGVYLTLPTAPGSIIDRSFAAHDFPFGDSGLPDDGWVVISGTSSASAQISATAALLLQVSPDLSPEDIKSVLCRTARRIDVGTSAQGGRSGPPYPNPATGAGLIDIAAALRAVSSRSSRACR